MLELVEFLSQKNVVLYLLLFTRLSGFFAFFPFFSHQAFPIQAKTGLIMAMTMCLVGLVELGDFEYTLSSLALAMVSELMLGFIAGLILNIVFGMLQMCGMHVSFVMGFSMASTVDPSTGANTPIISQVLTLIALVALLAFDGHHGMLLFIAKSLQAVPFGEFYPVQNVWHYLGNAMVHMFMMGISLAFPIVGFSLLTDIVFGMLMKTMPQFNLFQFGFSIKIPVGFTVLVVVMFSIMLIFKKHFLLALQKMTILFMQ